MSTFMENASCKMTTFKFLQVQFFSPNLNQCFPMNTSISTQISFQSLTKLPYILQSPGNNLQARALKLLFHQVSLLPKSPKWLPAASCTHRAEAPGPTPVQPGISLIPKGSLTNRSSELVLSVLPLQCHPHLFSAYFQDVDNASLSCPLHLALLQNLYSIQGPICSLSAQERSAFSSGSITCCTV